MIPQNKALFAQMLPTATKLAKAQFSSDQPDGLVSLAELQIEAKTALWGAISKMKMENKKDLHDYVQKRLQAFSVKMNKSTRHLGKSLHLSPRAKALLALTHDPLTAVDSP